MEVKLEKDISNVDMTTTASCSTTRMENGFFDSIINIGQLSNNLSDRKQRFSPLTVKWLVENYDVGEGVSLPCSFIYLHYMQHCAEQNLDPVNAATFGKLIRSVFLGLKTRRLCTQGSSKNHYYGIRIKNDVQKYGNEQDVASISSNNDKNDAINLFKSLLRVDAEVIPEFPEININDNSFTAEDVYTFKIMYRRLLEASVLAIRIFDFRAFKGLWKDFWNTIEFQDDDQKILILPRAKLINLASKKPVLDFITHVDTSFYMNIIYKFLPQVFKFIPIQLYCLMRNFANNMENWMKTSLVNCSDGLKHCKICAVTVFKQSFLRYLSLNRIAQSTSRMFESQKNLIQMITDYNRINFNALKRESIWLLNMNVNIINIFQQDLGQAFKNRFTIEEWATWSNVLLTKMTADEMTASEFVLKWSYFLSTIIRELLIIKSPSFGSFVLLHKFFDLYYMFRIEEKIIHNH